MYKKEHKHKISHSRKIVTFEHALNDFLKQLVSFVCGSLFIAGTMFISKGSFYFGISLFIAPILNFILVGIRFRHTLKSIEQTKVPR